MASDFDVQGKRVTVVGAARSGIAAAELLARRRAQVTLDRDARRGEGGGTACGVSACDSSSAATAARRSTAADLVVLSPGVPPNSQRSERARERGVPVIGELELASRWLSGRVVAITGTKGKSTTTALTGQILEAAGYSVTVGGNIGSPLSAQVSGSTPDTVARGRSQQLSARADRDVPSLDRGDAEFLA